MKLRTHVSPVLTYYAAIPLTFDTLS